MHENDDVKALIISEENLIATLTTQFPSYDLDLKVGNTSDKHSISLSLQLEKKLENSTDLTHVSSDGYER